MVLSITFHSSSIDTIIVLSFHRSSSIVSCSSFVARFLEFVFIVHHARSRCRSFTWIWLQFTLHHIVRFHTIWSSYSSIWSSCSFIKFYLSFHHIYFLVPSLVPSFYIWLHCIPHHHIPMLSFYLFILIVLLLHYQTRSIYMPVHHHLIFLSIWSSITTSTLQFLQFHHHLEFYIVT